MKLAVFHNKNMIFQRMTNFLNRLNDTMNESLYCEYLNASSLNPLNQKFNIFAQYKQ